MTFHELYKKYKDAFDAEKDLGSNSIEPPINTINSMINYFIVRKREKTDKRSLKWLVSIYFNVTFMIDAFCGEINSFYFSFKSSKDTTDFLHELIRVLEEEKEGESHVD